MYVSRVQAQSFPIQQSTSQYERIVSEKRDAQTQQQVCESQKMEIQEASKADRYVEQTADGMVSAAVSEQRQEAHLDQMRKSQCQSVEKSADGRIQVQRKKMVTEEYEQTHKECNVQIEKTLTSTKKYPFHDVNAPVIEGPGVLTVHFTNPQPLSSSSRTSGAQQAQKCTSTDQTTKETQQSAAQASSDCSTKTSTQQCCLKASQQTAQSSAKSELSQATPTPIKHVYAPGSLAPIRHVNPPGSTRKPNQDVIRPNVSQPNAGAAGGRQAGGISVAPKRGRGVLNAASLAGSRIALCGSCNMQIRSLTVRPPPPPVPVYSQINITVPYKCTSPQLDSIGSSPKSDYSSYSSSSSKNPQIQTTEAAREKIMSEIKGLTPKLKKISLSDTQSPRMSYIVNNTETVPTKNHKKVKSELLIPINDYTHEKFSDQDKVPLPDNLTFANKPNPNRQSENGNISNGVTKNAADYVTKDNLPDVAVCCICNMDIDRGPFITALGKIWCPNHFVCSTPTCRRPLQDLGFVEEHGQLYCEFCFEQYIAPPCSKCGAKIKGDCLKAIGKNFHPECFNCVYCGKLFGNSPFFLEDGNPYCDADWNELFTTKCYACGFPVEAGDRWVEALNNNYHSQCFNCTMCKKNLEGQSFFAKGGRPFCKNHAR
ncbi:hypothetical protein NQ318_002589 [Aromia moschata]|uniref:LIM zinc-binding domain-containing protein n=1 Tax=Aromia moschata TaxID=1265417 RepID=A0AAV8XWX1_9CUCU|nr:hypothetical protein NQ318_002589 [Aromia moschata]